MHRIRADRFTSIWICRLGAPERRTPFRFSPLPPQVLKLRTEAAFHIAFGVADVGAALIAKPIERVEEHPYRSTMAMTKGFEAPGRRGGRRRGSGSANVPRMPSVRNYARR